VGGPKIDNYNPVKKGRDQKKKVRLHKTGALGNLVSGGEEKKEHILLAI
jgi:hypothetical protein